MLHLTAKGLRAIVIVLILLFVSLAVFSRGPQRRSYSSGVKSSVGVRIGWSGGPTGITYRRVFAPGHAFEINAGYNPKEGRHSGLSFPRVGASMVDMRYQPFTLACDGDVGFVIYGSVGGRARIHHYRVLNENYNEYPAITPEFLGGGGIQLEFAEKMEVFADGHANYYNKKSGAWVWALETGVGFRVRFN